VIQVIEQHHLVVAFERRRDESPHVLVAAETVREHHGSRTSPSDHDVVPLESGLASEHCSNYCRLLVQVCH
jgi:hypothetical protein